MKRLLAALLLLLLPAQSFAGVFTAADFAAPAVVVHPLGAQIAALHSGSMALAMPVIIASGFSGGGGGGTTYTGTAPIVVTGSVLSCVVASGAAAGCLASADWTTFNGKLSGTANGITPASGTFTVTGALASSSTVQGTQLISTVSTGTAPMTAASTTKVTNLNADQVDGLEGAAFYVSGSTPSFGQITTTTGIQETAGNSLLLLSNSTGGWLKYTDLNYVRVTTSNVVIGAGDSVMGTFSASTGYVTFSPIPNYLVKINTTGTKTTCGAGNQGGLFYQNAADGDSTTATLFMCMESAANTFSYISIVTGG